jgi:hypothetical protein
MATPLIRDGKLLLVGPGIPAFPPEDVPEVICPDACPDLLFPQPATNPPSIRLTITAADAFLPFNWCGITWVKSVGGGGPADPLPANQKRSGEPACVCPSGYIDNPGGPPISSKTLEKWYQTAGNGLSLYRIYNSFTVYYKGKIKVETGSFAYMQSYKTNFIPTPTSSFTTPVFPGNPVINFGITTRPQFIPDSFFLQNITKNNRTYSWERGSRW